MRVVQFEGKTHQFPADATDDEVAAALEAAAAPVKRGLYTATDGQVSALKDELASEYRNFKAAADEETRQQHAKNIISIRRTLGNKATDLPNIAGDSDPDYVALLNYVDQLDRGGPAKFDTLPDTGTPGGMVPVRASQRDIRRMEDPNAPTSTTPMERQGNAESTFEARRKQWLKTTGGVLRPGQNVRQAVAEWVGMQDPAETRDAAQAAHLKETGEFVGDEDTVGMQAVKPAAAMIGFSVGGPAGATAAEAAVRYAVVASALDKAVKAGSISEDVAASILYEKMAKGMGMDALFNFGLPLVGEVVKRLPGAKWVGEKVGALVEKAVGPRMPKPSQRDVKLADRAALLPEDDVAGRKAVELLGKKSKDVVPTPGQVLDDAGTWESNVRKSNPKVFHKQGKEIEDAATAALRGATTPEGQMTREDIGGTIARIAEDTAKATKARLRPVFEAADNIGVQVDMREVRHEVSRALLADSRVAGGRLKPGERADLERIFEALRENPSMTAEAALDFISRRKEMGRAIHAEDKPSEFFSTILSKLTRGADQAYTRAAQAAGEGGIVRDLLRARQQYGSMMETVYDDAVKQALKRDPEEVGRLFWRSGNVAEIKQLRRLLGMAQREGVTGAAGSSKLQLDVTRGFLQEAVPNIEAAAKWSKTLAEKPGVRDTWNALTATPAGRELRNTMEVVERAAQMALRDNYTLATQGLVPLQRAGSGSMGVSNVSVKPGWIVLGVSLTGLTKAAATAYTQGEKGVGNLIMQALRANGAGTAASAKVLQETLPKLYEWAEKNGMADEIFQQEPAAQ